MVNYFGEIDNKKKKNSRNNSMNNSMNFFGNHNKIKTRGRSEYLTSPVSKNSKPFMFANPPKSVYNKNRLHVLGLTGPYGDRDFDGSPNKWDCSPNDPGKDGLLHISYMGESTFG